MKKFVVLALALALTAGAAYANYCARDYVPAATLLVPYAVVSMNSNLSAPDATGYTTLLSVTNVSADVKLIHVTVWSALSTPVVDFDEVLSGYDVWTINFRDLLTGHFDYFDTNFDGFWKGGQGPDVTPFGPTTNAGFATRAEGPWDTDTADDTGCNNPYGYHPEYGAGIISALAYDIFPLSYEYASCMTSVPFAAPPWLKNIDYSKLWFYVTVDVVNACNQYFPSGSDYWEGGYPLNENVLIGEVIYLNTFSKYSEAMAAVHVEAQIGQDSGKANFYSIHYDDAAGFDTREPLADAFAFRYYDSGGASTELLLWKSDYELTYVNSLQNYAWWACGPYVYYAWDEDENSKSRTGGPSGFDNPEPNVIPFETQAAPIDPTNWTGVMATNGWMLLIFDSALTNHYDYTPWYEAWAGVRYLYTGFSAGLEAATMANTWCFPTQDFPNLSYSFMYFGNWY